MARIKEPIKIRNIRIYGVHESAIAANYPMRTKPIGDMYEESHKPNLIQKLYAAKPASGHDCAAKGIVLQFDLTAPEYFWRQWDRYHFADHVSSQSKMHCITKFEIETMCNTEVDQIIIDNLKRLIDEGASIRKIVSNTPCGFMLTSRITTNLLQLKNIKNQRRNHKLPEWQIMIEFIQNIEKELGMIK